MSSASPHGVGRPDADADADGGIQNGAASRPGTVGGAVTEDVEDAASTAVVSVREWGRDDAEHLTRPSIIIRSADGPYHKSTNGKYVRTGRLINGIPSFVCRREKEGNSVRNYFTFRSFSIY